VGDLIRSIIGYAITIAMIVGGFKFYKTQEKAYLDANDHSMRAEEYSSGGYSLDTKGLSMEDYKVGDVVAFRLFAKPDEHRIGRIVALEGQKIEVVNKTVKVDGKSTLYKVDLPDWVFPDIRVPRGCAFILSDVSSFWSTTEAGIGDSMRIGPIPYYSLMGKLN
jgi:hypothetical protein